MKILLVEDSPHILEAIQLALSGHDIFVAKTLHEAARKIENARYDLALLDYHLPDGNTEKLCKQIVTERIACSVLYLTGESSAGTASHLLDIGADDYIRKPFDLKELLSRINAVTRRTTRKCITIADLSFYIEEEQIEYGGIEVNLRPTEVKLAIALAKHHPARVSEATLIEEVWYDEALFSNTVNVHISRLRRQLETQNIPIEIENVRGMGYRLKPKEGK